jgi:hypothetical protein
MKPSPRPNPPVLAPPGAGLPTLELWIARFLFGRFRRRMTTEQHSAFFESERARILALGHTCDAERGARRVLVQRIRGMEDSSRYWSVFMTLDHLRIVNNAFAGIIASLARGEVPPGAARTADVKPRLDADASVFAGFGESCDRFLHSAAKAPAAKSEVSFPHPWFGPLEAEGWHALGGFHLRLHRRQIERILPLLDDA